MAPGALFPVVEIIEWDAMLNSIEFNVLKKAIVLIGPTFRSFCFAKFRPTLFAKAVKSVIRGNVFAKFISGKPLITKRAILMLRGSSCCVCTGNTAFFGSNAMDLSMMGAT
jgi:hypothetical protein